MRTGSVRPLAAAVWGALAVAAISADALPRVPDVVAVFTSIPNLVRPVTAPAFAAHWIRLVLAVAAAAIAVCVAGGLGSALTRLASRRPPAREAGSFAAGTFSARALAGLALASTAGLGLGLAGLLFPPVTTAVAFGLAAAGISAGPRLPRWRLPSGLAAAPAAVALAVFAAWTLFAVPPQTWVDTIGYHFGTSALWTRLHRVSPAPDSHFQFPLLFEHLLSLTGGWIDPAMLNLAVLGILTLLLAAWTARRFGTIAGWLAAAGWLASAQTGFLAAHVKHDLLAAAYVLLAVVLWDGRGRSLACGAALGWSFAAKYPSAAPGLAILAWEILRPGRRAFRLAALGAGGLAAAAPFLCKSWLQTGNPVFPFLFDGLGWGEAQRHALELFGCPGQDLDLANPGSFPRTVLRLGAEMAPLGLVGIPLLLLGPAGGARAARPLAAVAAGLLFGAFFLPCLRFMVPVFPLLAMLGAGGLVTLARGGPVRRAAAGFLAGAALLLGAVQGASMADFTRRPIAAALGLEPADRYLDRVLTTFQHAVADTGSLPASGRILLLGDSRGAPFNGTRTAFSQDILDDPLPLVFAREARDAGGIAKRFRELGITYVVLNHVTSEYRGGITQQAFPWPPAALARYHEFWARWTEPVPARPAIADAENGGFAFYRLRRNPGPMVSAMSFLPGTEGLGIDASGGGPAGTIRRLQAVLQFAPGVAQLQSRLWTALLEAREYVAAESWIRDGMALGFRAADVWASLGAALEGQGRFREAAGAFRRAAALDPSRPEYAARLAACEAAPARRVAAPR